MSDNLVVGSGPTGVAAALALLEAGEEVRLIDPGAVIEPEVLPKIEHLRTKEVADWQADDLRFLRQNLRFSSSGFETKLSYGSDYCYRWLDPLTDFSSQQHPAIKGSFAPGGLSRVWGAGVLTFADEDFAGWPISFDDLRPHYHAVLRFIPYAAQSDELTGTHPLIADVDAPLGLSRASRRFLEDAARHGAALRLHGLSIAPSRLAVYSADCRYCGLCLCGCPYGLIWSADAGLAALAARFGPRLSYEPGWIVDKLQETGDGISATCVSLDASRARTFVAQRVFLAAGVLQTTKIIAKTLGLYGRTIHLKDSQYFTVPFLRWRRVRGVTEERLSTLAQLFVELRDPALATPPVLLSVYSYSDQMFDLLRSRLRLLGPGAGPLAQLLAERLLAFAGYLHSDLSSSLEFRLSRVSGTRSTITLSSRIEPTAAAAVRRVVAHLARLGRWLGGRPLSPLLHIADPGTAYHFGGSFPMSQNPQGAFTSDWLGRPGGLRRAFIVDAANFPSIPAGTVTVNAMANAHRIATKARQAV